MTPDRGSPSDSAPPDPSRPPFPLGRRDFLYALSWLLFGLVTYGIGIGARDLWDPDEPRYAQVAREMRVDGHWIVPHINGRVYGHKPPLFFWTVAGLSFLTGQVDSWTARAPSVVAAGLLLALTALFGTRWFGRRVGALAAAVLASNYLFVSLAIHANIDQLHALWTTSALFLWFEGMKGERPAAGLMVATGLLAGLALLTKGVGVLLVLLVAGAGLRWSPRRRDGRAWAWIGATLAIAVAVAACWYLPALYAAGSDYGREIGLRQTVTRLTDPWSHERWVGYFLVNFPLDTLPWSVFLPAVVAGAVASWSGPNARTVRFLSLWCLVVFVFFSASASKRHIYLLPLCPAWALLTAGALAGPQTPASDGPRDLPGWPFVQLVGAWTATVALGIAGLAAVIGGPLAGEGAIARFAEDADVRAAAVPLLGPCAIAGAVVLLHAAALAWAVVARRTGIFTGVMVSLVAGITLFAQGVLLPRLDSVRSARPFGETLARVVPREAELASYGFFQEEAVFYSGRTMAELVFEPANDEEKARKQELQLGLLREFLDRDGIGWVFQREKDWDRLGDLRARLEESWRGRMGGDIVVLARERP